MKTLMVCGFVVLCLTWALLAMGIGRIVNLLEQIRDNRTGEKENCLHEWERFLAEEEDDEK